MSPRPSRRVFWLAGLAGLLVVANIVDQLFFSEEAPKPPPRAVAAKGVVPIPAARAQSVEALRARLEHLRSVAHSAAEVRQSYAKVALPYAESMASLPTFFARGTDPKTALEGAVRRLAKDAGLEVDSLVSGVPQRVGPGVLEGLAKLTVRAGDSDAMLRFFAEAGRPGNGMIWNGFQLSADPQGKQLTISGELRVLLVESAE